MHQRSGGSLDAEHRRTLSTVRGAATGNEYWADRLHHLAAYNAGRNRLGIVPILTAAATAYSAHQAGKGGGGGGAGSPVPGGPTTGMQQPGAGATAVSPTFQTQISPQISPVFSQMQDSAGATQAATTTQYQPGGFQAEGGSAHGGGGLPVPPSPSYFSGPTKGGGLPYTPLDPRTLTNIRDLPHAGTLVRDIEEAKGFNWTPVYVIGGVAVAGGLLYLFLTRKK